DITERKQAAEALRQSEERYRTIVENIRDVIWTTDKDLRYTYLSPTIMRQRGYSVEEAMALGPEDILTPASLEVVLKAFTPDAAADNGERNKLIKPRPLELEVYCKNGSTIWTETEVAYIRDSDGQIIGTIGTTRDITERKQAEEKLRMSEHKFKDLIETTPDWVWEIDENGVYTYVSPNIEQLLGYEVNEVLGKTPFDLMPREEAKKIGKTFKEIVIKRDPIHRLGNINRHRDGHLVVLETNGIPFYDEEGVFKGYRGIDRDITERKRAEEALREKEEHYRALIENSLEAIAIIDGEGAIQYLGPSFERLMGYDLEEYLGKNPFDHVHTDDRSRVAAIFAELMQKPGAIVQEEIRVLHKNGSLRTVEVVGQNLLHNPAVGGLVANIRDITERKQAAEKLQALYQQEKDLREQIEKEMKRRVEFTRVLAHELKTPLTSVLASSDLLISEVRDEPLLSLAKNIRQGASNLNSRIDELLDLARGEVGMLQLKREPVDLSHLLREAADSMTPLALGRGQSIILRLPPALPTVQADTTRLQQIVTNLLNNAVKFTPKGGSIILRARKKDASVIVEVQDTGRGIPKREQERLFEPYQRLEEAEENLSGLGLGLSLCKTLVELHGGQIWMRSHVGRGSTFGFSLPLEAADKQATEPEKIAKLWKVLIIEDDQQIVDSVSLTFRLRWPEVQLISTGLGEEGIEMAETEAPDIVILDLGLPDISGFDALRQIRLFSSVPVVILTVREDESDMVKGLEWGADDYLVKPFKQLELLARLKVQLRKQTPPDEEAPIVCGPLRLEPSTFQLTHDGKEISLTIIEGRILECLMRNAGHIVTHSRLAETVWGEDYPRALDSLRVYIRYLREKIEANPSKPKIILTKAGVGYSLAKPV
ncbi:MAG: PAS domain S-box protein, partial [Dehalococcoidia bacterium]|nr:PAS domain S-box protein [Dehalococcoidia bacterium]